MPVVSQSFLFKSIADVYRVRVSSSVDCLCSLSVLLSDWLLLDVVATTSDGWGIISTTASEGIVSEKTRTA